MALSDSYRWSDDKGRSTLFHGFSWAAVVTETSVEIKGRGGQRLGGPCSSVAQGKRFVERWIWGRLRSTYRPIHRSAQRPPPAGPAGPDPTAWPFTGAPLNDPSGRR